MHKWPGGQNGRNHCHRTEYRKKNEKKKKEKEKEEEESLRDLWDNIKQTNSHIIGVPEGEKREWTLKNIWRYNSWNFLNMGKEIVNQVQEKQSPRQDRHEEEHAKTHSNQNDGN